MSDVKEFIDKLHHTHKAEWEATPKIQDSIDWLTNLFEFLFPTTVCTKKQPTWASSRRIKSTLKIFY